MFYLSILHTNLHHTIYIKFQQNERRCLLLPKNKNYPAKTACFSNIWMIIRSKSNDPTDILSPPKSKRYDLDLYRNSPPYYPSEYHPQEKFRLSHTEKRWIRLNFKLFLLIGLPILLFVPPVTLLFNSIASITESIRESVVNLAMTTVPLGIIFLLIMLIIAMLKK